jgi:phage terminase small subunit
MSKELTEKQKRFCEEWMIDMNSTQAATRAGYSARTANEQGARLLANVSVQGYINELRKKLSKKLEITQERVLKEYARIGFSDIRGYYNEDGSLKKITDLDDDAAAAIAGVEVDELWEPDGDGGRKQVGETKKVKRWDKRAALDSICKVLGYNAPEKIEHSGDSFLDLLMQTSASNTSENKPRQKKKPKPKAKKPARKPGRKK